MLTAQTELSRRKPPFIEAVPLETYGVTKAVEINVQDPCGRESNAAKNGAHTASEWKQDRLTDYPTEGGLKKFRSWQRCPAKRRPSAGLRTR